MNLRVKILSGFLILSIMLFTAGALSIFENNITVPGEKEHIEIIKATYASYKNLWVRPIVDTLREGDLQWYYGNVHQAFLKSKVAVNRLMTLNNKTMYQTASALQNRAGRAIMPGIVAIVSALVFTIIFNFFINLYVILPIKRFTAGIQDYIKSGDQSGLSVDSNDEISDLAKAIRDFIAHAKLSDK